MTHQTLQPVPDTAIARPAVIQRACACDKAAGVAGQRASCAAEEQLGVQPKLTINIPGDRYEQEADRIADQVTATRPTPVTGPLAITPLLQRQPIEEEEIIQPKSSPSGRATTAGSASNAATAVTAAGQPMSGALRNWFEPRFGHDLGHVRLHTTPAAQSAARGIRARAYTLGNHIAFAEGQFAPHTPSGLHLLAHELTHTLQQGSRRQRFVQRVCSPNSICSAPSIPGNPRDFGDSEEARELRGRQRRQRMSPTRARSTGHAGRARQLETLLSAHSASRRALVHGVFIDADLSRGTAAMLSSCQRWRNESLPAGDPDPHGMASATKPCIFIPGLMNRQALRYNNGARQIAGQPRERWRIEAVNTLVHETEHERFDSGIQPGLARPAGVTTAACTKGNVQDALSEIVAISSEFPLHHSTAQAEASPTGPAHRRLVEYFDFSFRNSGESFHGALLAMGCKCDCSEVDMFLIQAVNAMTSSWTTVQKTAFRTGLQARMPGPARPLWPAVPT